MRIAWALLIAAVGALTLRAEDGPRPPAPGPGPAPLGPRVEITPRDGSGTRICHLRSFREGMLEVIFGTGETHNINAADVVAVRFVPPERPPQPFRPERPDNPDNPPRPEPERHEPGRPNNNPIEFVLRAQQFRALYRKKLRGKLDQNEAAMYEKMDAETQDKPMAGRGAAIMKAQEDASYAEETGKLYDFIEQSRAALKAAERPDQARAAVERLIAGYREQGTIRHALLEKITDDIKLVKPHLRDEAKRQIEELRGFINMPLNGVLEREMGRRPPPDGRDKPKP